MVKATSMNCPNCGNPVEKDSPYCLKCLVQVERPTFWQKLVGFFQPSAKPSRPIINIKKIITVTTDEGGQHHEYHSLKEVPPELRTEIEKLRPEDFKEDLSAPSSDGFTAKWISDKTISVFKVKDALGNEHTYHSLEELPPEIRAALEKAQNQAKD
jgi:hypothetical protein